MLKISNSKFSKRINKIFEKYKIEKSNKTADQLCNPKKFKLQNPQMFVSQYINPKTPYRDLLVFHQIGSGKTCSSIQIAEKWKKTHKIIVITPASLVENYRKELLSACTKKKYLKTKKNIKKINPNSTEYKRIIRKSYKYINKHYCIYSYQSFLNAVQNKKIRFKNKVFIVDEVQNIVSDKGSMYKKYLKIFSNIKKNSPIVLLSATPMFDKPHEIALTLNLLRIPNKIDTKRFFYKKYVGENGIIINRKDFKDKIKGYVSFYQGADSKTFPKRNNKTVNCEMSNYQYAGYRAIISSDKSKIKNLYDIPNDFFINSRLMSNIAFPNYKLGKKGIKSFEKILDKGKNKKTLIKKYSNKFYKVIKNIEKTDGLVFVYSNYVTSSGLSSFILILNSMGYKNFYNEGPGTKRYAIWSGEITMKKRVLAKNVFNNYKNRYGKNIKIILGSPAIKEGVSLLRLRQIHILEPYWNTQLLEQVVGRGFRYCSHKDMPKKERQIDVFYYISSYKKVKTVDKYIYELAYNKQKIIKQFEQILKETSVDCWLNQNSNTKKVKCGFN